MRKALRQSSRSVRSIAREANVNNQSVHYFIHGRYDITLRIASALADVVMPNWNSRTKFLHETDTADHLGYMIQTTQNKIQIVGNETLALSELEDAVSKRGVSYQRIVTGEYVPSGLDIHLRRAAEFPNCEVYRTPVPCQPMAMTDESVLLLLSGADGVFGGLHLTGDEFKKNFSEYLQEVFNDDRTNEVTY